MFLVVGTHLIKSGRLDEAKERLDANGDRMRASSGFVFRYRTVAAENDHKLVTITGWDDEPSFSAYREASRGAGPAGDTPYVEVVQDFYNLEAEQLAPESAV
ncbi:MAG: hypothetical protein OXL97_01920 [Chloroflexota bacterium]|nr:hypothetical protein [Chloroflexota bacterium]MDE2886449.1 hypothetical protein [Chloroflexota bacterium]